MKNNQCPDNEVIACYVDGLLSKEEKITLDRHVSTCQKCKEVFAIQEEVAKLQEKEGLSYVPPYVIERAKNLVNEKFGLNVLEVLVEFRDEVFKAVRSTGEIIAGLQLQPAFSLRGNQAESVKTLSIKKVFDNVRVEIEITREQGDLNTVVLKVKDEQVETPLSDLRATLIQDEIELESYITKNGKAIFENIKQGKYLIQISSPNNPVGIINLELNKE